MPKPRRREDPRPHEFRNKLLLNQWLISLFGIDPMADNKERPFLMLADPIKDPEQEGMDSDNLHHFYHYLGESPLFSDTQPERFCPASSLITPLCWGMKKTSSAIPKPSTENASGRWYGNIING